MKKSIQLLPINVGSTMAPRLGDQFSEDSGSWPMFVRTTTDRTPRPNSLRELGMSSDSNPIVSLSDFTCKKGTVYGEKELAE